MLTDAISCVEDGKKGDMIIFSFIGMKDVREKYTGQNIQDAAMQQDAKSLDEVVVVARQNINELDIRAKSGVVQNVDMGRLNSKPMIDMSLALQGSVPGLIVTNTGDLGSEAGNSYSWKLVFFAKGMLRMNHYM